MSNGMHAEQGRYERTLSAQSRLPSSRRTIRKFYCSLIVLALSSGHAFGEVSQLLGAPVSTKAFSGSASWTRRQLLSNGYLVSFTNGAGNSNAITLTALATQQEIKVSFQVNGVSPIITGAAVIAENRLVVSGLYAAGDTNHPFLAYTNFSGQASSVVDLGSFVANQVCTGGDGTAWVLGQDMEKEGQIWKNRNETTETQADEDYDMLRAYGPNGALLKSSFRRSDLHTSYTTSWFVNLATGSNLVCGSDSIGAYIAMPAPVVAQPIWYELRTSDNSVQTWKVYGAPASAGVTGLALPYTNTLYSSFSSLGKSVSIAGVYTLTLGNNGIATWTANVVRSDSAASPAAHLKVLGADGDQVVYVNGSAINTQLPIVAWSPVTKSSVLDSAIEAPLKTPSEETTETGTTATDAGNVQIAVDGADGLLIEITKYNNKVSAQTVTPFPMVCYSAACVAAEDSIRATVEAWRGTKGKATRTVALAVSTKETLAAQMAAFGTALKAEPYPVPKTGGGGGGGGGCVITGPNSKSPGSQTAQPQCWAPPPREVNERILIRPDVLSSMHRESRRDASLPTSYEGYFDGTESNSQDEGHFIPVTLSTCREDCNFTWTAYGAACLVVAGVVGSKAWIVGVITAVYCFNSALSGYQKCVTNCANDVADCPTQNNYDALYREDMAPFRREPPMRRDNWGTFHALKTNGRDNRRLLQTIRL